MGRADSACTATQLSGASGFVSGTASSVVISGSGSCQGVLPYNPGGGDSPQALFVFSVPDGAVEGSVSFDTCTGTDAGADTLLFIGTGCPAVGASCRVRHRAQDATGFGRLTPKRC